MRTWTVPVYSQGTLNLCWEACGRMLHAWRHGSLRDYANRAGTYASLDTGLSEAEMNRYYGMLGLRALRHAGGQNVRHALHWTPVVVTSIDQAQGHAMVVCGYSAGHYTVINPCAVQAISFDGGHDSCTGATLRLPRQAVDGPLGSYIWYW